MLKHPHRLSIPSKCYFPQIVWFTVNEFSLPIIIWWSFRSPPDIGHCCRKHERKYLEISACSSGGRRPRYPPQPREWRKLSIDKRDFELRERPLLFWMESCLWKIAFIINSYFHAGRWKMAVALFVSDGNKVICILKCKPWPHSMCDILYIFNSLLVETSSQQNIILLEFLVWESKFWAEHNFPVGWSDKSDARGPRDQSDRITQISKQRKNKQGKS